MKKSLPILLLFFIVNGLVAQDYNEKADSLSAQLEILGRNDHARRMELLGELYGLYFQDNLPMALSTARMELSTAQKAGSNQFLAEANDHLGYTYYMQGYNDSALFYLDQAYALHNGMGETDAAARSANNIANVYRITARYDTAMVIYNDILKYYESVTDKTQVAQVLSNIGSLYYTAGNQEKAKEYTLKSIEMQRQLDDPRGLAVSLVNLAVFCLNIEEYAEGAGYGDEAIGILREIDQNYYAAALVRTGYCYYCMGESQKALDYTAEAIDIYRNNDNIRGLLEAYRTQGDYFMEIGRYAEARAMGLAALERADTTNRLDIRLTYDLLKRSAIRLNLQDEALYYSQMQIDMKEADLNDEWAARISETEAKYESEKKELEIKNLTAKKRVQLVLIVSLLIIIAVGGVVGRQARMLSRQRIKELEKEKKLTATMALLEGENSERTRLSRDLHDGLGGMLSVAKLKISNMKGSMTIPQEQVASFNAAIDLLDGSIRELRRVAHNLMPESLVKYGLHNALNDFCESTGKVSYHFYGTDRRVDDKIEVALYRIVCELVNNALKHSGASEINVQLLIDNSRINVVVEDNGKGFNLSAADSGAGNGLKNVRSRVNSLGGKLEIISSPGKGSEINVEFNC